MTIAVAGACTDATGGQAVGNGGGDTGTSDEPQPSSDSGEPTVDLPQRPKELSLDGLEPCSVLTQTQVDQLATEFKFDKPPEPYKGEGDVLCTVEQSAEPFQAVDILLITNKGIEQWLGDDNNVDSWPVTIADYPAVSFKLAGTDDEECSTSVGVADNQQLMVNYPPLGSIDYRELCKVTERIATMATETLKTLR
ncbi:DUF3558 domain-containing protein [Actinophytocola sediminis]